MNDISLAGKSTIELSDKAMYKANYRQTIK